LYAQIGNIMNVVYRSVYVQVNEIGVYASGAEFDVYLKDRDIDVSKAEAIDHLNAVITDAKKAITMLRTIEK
jgi:hypothetical protein